MKVHQEHIKRTLEAKNIPYEEIDVADPHYKKEKDFMKEIMKLTDEAMETLPPQIFKDGQWKGVRKQPYINKSFLFLTSKYLQFRDT